MASSAKKAKKRSCSDINSAKVPTGIGLEIRISLALSFAKDQKQTTLSEWLTVDRVRSVRKKFRGDDYEKSRKLTSFLAREQCFNEMAQKAKDMMASESAKVYKVQSQLRAMLVEKEMKQKLLTPVKKLKRESASNIRVLLTPRRLPLKRDADYEGGTDLIREDGKVMMKSPNFLMLEAGCPPELEESEEGRAVRYANCASNCIQFGIQIMLKEGFLGLYQDFTCNLETAGSDDLMVNWMKALFENEGDFSLESEQARTAAVLRHKEQVTGKSIFRGVSNSNVWITDIWKAWLKLGQMQSCLDCGITKSTLEQPNINRSEFLQLTKEENKVAEALEPCLNCEKPTKQQTTFVFPCHGVLIDLEGEDIWDDNVLHLLAEFPREANFSGQELDQLIIFLLEKTGPLKAHVYCLHWQGDQLVAVDDAEPYDWNKRFAVGEDHRPGLFSIGGIIYGKRTASSSS